jgi:hypothetical protein
VPVVQWMLSYIDRPWNNNNSKQQQLGSGMGGGAKQDKNASALQQFSLFQQLQQQQVG